MPPRASSSIESYTRNLSFAEKFYKYMFLKLLRKGICIIRTDRMKNSDWEITRYDKDYDRSKKNISIYIYLMCNTNSVRDDRGNLFILEN